MPSCLQQVGTCHTLAVEGARQGRARDEGRQLAGKHAPVALLDDRLHRRGEHINQFEFLKSERPPDGHEGREHRRCQAQLSVLAHEVRFAVDDFVLRQGGLESFAGLGMHLHDTSDAYVRCSERHKRQGRSEQSLGGLPDLEDGGEAERYASHRRGLEETMDEDRRDTGLPADLAEVDRPHNPEDGDQNERYRDGEETQTDCDMR